jgi:hypothetical protein
MGMTNIIALALFALAAGGGVLLAGLRLKNRALPMPIALVHGGLAAAGLLLLLVGVVRHHAATPVRVALGLFVVAALGGFYLFSHHVRGKRLPLGVVGVHGAAAVVAFLLLLLGVL